VSDCDPLRYLCTRYGPVEIAHITENDPHCWTVTLVSLHDGTSTWNHEHGERLETTIQALLTNIENNGILTMEDALKLGSVSP
jgi:hypothetical protein